MSRIPTHTVEDAPAASRPLLQKIVEATPMGRPREPPCPDGGRGGGSVHVAARRACRAHQLRPEGGCGLDFSAAAAGVGNSYIILIASRLAQMNGWTEEQVTALTTGISTNDAKIDGLAGLVRKAAANSGNVTDATWKAAQQAGWSNEQLADAFAYLGATVFTGYFLDTRKPTSI